MSEPPAVFRDVKKAEEHGIIIATDVICPICGDPCPAEDPPHRKCLDKRVIETFERTMASNTQIVESNRQVAKIFSDLNATMQKVAGQPTTPLPAVSSPPIPVSVPEGEFKVSVTVPPRKEVAPATPLDGDVLFPFPNATLPISTAAPKSRLSLMQRRVQAILARRRARAR